MKRVYKCFTGECWKNHNLQVTVQDQLHSATTQANHYTHLSTVTPAATWNSARQVLAALLFLRQASLQGPRPKIYINFTHTIFKISNIFCVHLHNYWSIQIGKNRPKETCHSFACNSKKQASSSITDFNTVAGAGDTVLRLHTMFWVTSVYLPLLSLQRVLPQVCFI